ncbi:MAG: hypothetical protein H6733_15115 [Alphaproteobacteria bacterium]|nr:hypothetical protein [Alphaproteobacteria bacterium]
MRTWAWVPMAMAACGPVEQAVHLPFADVPDVPVLPAPADPDAPWAGCSIVQQEWRRNDLPHPGDTSEDEPGARSEIVYDDAQRLIARRSWNAAPLDAPPTTFDALHYDDGRLVSRVAGSTATGTPTGTETFYDDSGRTDRVVLFDGYEDDRQDTEVQRYEYDDGRLAAIRIDRDLDGRTDEVTSWRYETVTLDGGGRAETTFEYAGTDVPTGITRRTYDADGRLTIQEELAWTAEVPGEVVVVEPPLSQLTWRYVDGRTVERWERRRGGTSASGLVACSHDRWTYDDLDNLATYERRYAVGPCGSLDGGSRTTWERDADGTLLAREDATLDDLGHWDDQVEVQYVHHDSYTLPDGIAWGEVFPRSTDPSYVTVIHEAPNGATLASVRHSAWSGEVAIVDLVVQQLDPWGRFVGRVYWGLYDAPDVPTEFLLLTYTTVQADCPVSP